MSSSGLGCRCRQSTWAVGGAGIIWIWTRTSTLISGRLAGPWDGGRLFLLTRYLVLLCSRDRRSPRSGAFARARRRTPGLMVAMSGLPRFLRASGGGRGQSADPGRREPAAEALRITHTGLGEHEFLTDRGPEVLPAYWLRGPVMNGPLWVLDPAIEFWEPPKGPRAHHPPPQRKASRFYGRSRSLPTVSRSSSRGLG